MVGRELVDLLFWDAAAEEMESSRECGPVEEAMGPERGVLAAVVRVDVAVLDDDRAAPVGADGSKHACKRPVWCRSVLAEQRVPVRGCSRMVDPAMRIRVDPGRHSRLMVSADAELTLDVFC